MAASTGGFVRSLGFALLGVTVFAGLKGLTDLRRGGAFGERGAAYREVADFLERARAALRAAPGPKGRVLVVGSIVPQPDLDFWFGLDEPVDWLAAVDPVEFRSAAGGEGNGALPSESELRSYYERLDRNLTRERFQERRAGKRWVVCLGEAARRQTLELDPGLKDKLVLDTPAGAVARLSP